MYNLNGIELDLDEKMMDKYAEIIIAPIGSEHFDESLKLLATVGLQTESFEKAVYLYGVKTVAKKIVQGMEDELAFISVERE